MRKVTPSAKLRTVLGQSLRHALPFEEVGEHLHHRLLAGARAAGLRG